MSATDNTFAGCAARRGNPDHGFTGAIIVNQFSLTFEAEGFQIEMPFSLLQIAAHPVEEEKVVFSHPESPEWEVSTYASEILDHPFLTKRTALWPQIKALKHDLEGHGGHERLVLTVLAGIGGLFLLLWACNNRIIRWAVNQAPISWEQDLGKKVMAEVRQDKTIRFVTDPALTNRLFAVTQRLVAGQKGPHTFRFYLVDDPTVNAFALPGGHILVLTGLVQATGSPEELAGVLAHEMAHITERHGFRAIAESAGPSILAKFFLGNQGGFLSALAATSSFLGQQRYSRRHESEADEKGWDLLVAAKIDPKGMIEFLKKTRELEGRQGSENAYLSSHPPTSQRIEALRGKIRDIKLGTRFEPLPTPTNSPAGP